MKILVSAYACEPGKGSEEGIGWNIIKQLARYHQVWVLTRPDAGQDNIEAELQRNPNSNLNFIYCTTPLWGDGWNWGTWGVQFHYYLWQIQAYFVGRKLHKKINFDFIHHVTYGRYWTPSFLSLLPIPFIFGPVGGGESAPKAFWSDFSRQGQIYETMRDIARGIGEKDPFVGLTVRRCAIVFAQTKETAARLEKLGAKQIEILSNVALPTEEIEKLICYPLPEEQPVRFISIGRLLHWKGFHLGLKAFAMAKLENAEYWIIGDGPERQRLEALSQELGLTDKVRFWGSLKRSETLSVLAKCHALIHPSLHDSGGWVCAEMMAAGRPVVCLDLGGPALQVTAENGFKVAGDNPEQAINDIAVAMTHLASDRALLIRKGQTARKNVQELWNWTIKGEFLARVYDKFSS